MTGPATTLDEHAARLLVGTGLDPAQAHQVASGRLPATGAAAAAALREGWTSPDRARTLPAPPPATAPSPGEGAA